MLCLFTQQKNLSIFYHMPNITLGTGKTDTINVILYP